MPEAEGRKATGARAQKIRETGTAVRQAESSTSSSSEMASKQGREVLLIF